MCVGFPQLRFIRFAFLLLPLFLAPPAGAQEKSVKPGINAPYEKNPDPKKFLAKFEVEGREAFTLRKEIVAACRLKPGMSVADVGAGTGLFTRLFAEEVAPGGTVYATDIAENFLKHIAVTCKEAGIKNVKTVLSKVDSSELPPGAVDVVFLCDVYHHFEFPAENAGLAPCRPQARRPARGGRLPPRERQEPAMALETRPRRVRRSSPVRSKRPASSSKARRSFSKTTT